MFSLPYFIVTFLIILHISLAYFLSPLTAGFDKKVDFSFVDQVNKLHPGPNVKPYPAPYPKPGPELKPETNPNTLPQCVPQYMVTPQCNPRRGFIFSNDPSVTLFINTFLQAVYTTDILREVFDIRQTTPKQYGDFVRRYVEKALRNIGVENAAALGEFAARAIAPNFDILTLQIVASAHANIAANFIFVEKYLEINNAEDLGLAYAQSIADSAKVSMNSDPTSKFKSFANGFVNFFLSLGLFTKEKAPLLAYYFGNEWFVAAVNCRYF